MKRFELEQRSEWVRDIKNGQQVNELQPFYYLSIEEDIADKWGAAYSDVKIIKLTEKEYNNLKGLLNE